jgi:hypothetical protein
MPNFEVYIYPVGNFCTYLGICKTVCFTFYDLGVKITTWVWNLQPGYESYHLGMNLTIWIWNLLPGYVTYYLGMLLTTWVWILLHGFETYYMGMKLTSWVWNLIPGYKTYHLRMKVLTGCETYFLGVLRETNCREIWWTEHFF